MTLKKEIFALLKNRNLYSPGVLPYILNRPQNEIRSLVLNLVREGYLRYDNDGNIYAPVLLNPVRALRAGLWSYEEIERRLQKGVSSLPGAYLNQQLIAGIVHRCQGRSPTCVGNAVAECADILYLKKTGDYPTPADWQKCRNNVLFDPNNPNGAYYDTHLPMSYSATCAYYGAREVGHVTAPGAFIDDAALYWRQDGLCRSWQWYLVKDGVTQFKDPYPDTDPVTGEKARDSQKKHKIAGFATVTTQDGIKRAVLENDCVLIAYEVSENYRSWKDGTLRWKGASVGSHAGVIVGWDDAGSHWWILQTWRDEGYPKLMKMPYSYWNRAKVGAIALVPGDVARWVRERVYRHVTITLNGIPTNQTVDYQIGREKVTGPASGVGADLILGETYTISATVPGRKGLGTRTVTITEETRDVVLEWVEQDTISVITPEKPLTLGDKIRVMVRDALNRAFGRK